MYYGVYLAYSQYEVADEYNPKLPEYPREYSRVVLFNNPSSQLNFYANTPCPASQTFEAETKEELALVVENLQKNFEDKEWLEEHIYPYI